MTQLNQDINFSEITTGDSHEISEITAADPAVITFAGGDELVTNSEMAGDSYAGWSSSNGAILDSGDSIADYSIGTTGGLDDYCLSVTNDGTNDGRAQEFIPVEADAWYTISCRAYAPSTNTKPTATQVQIWSNNWTQLAYTSGTVEDSWETLSIIVQATDTTLRVGLLVKGLTSDDVTYYDKISVKLLHNYTAGDVISIGGVEDGAVGAELHTDANAASIGNEADATTGFTGVSLAGTGANVFESQGVVVSDGSYAFHADSDDTPTGGARFYKDLETDFGLVVGAWYRISVDVRHIGGAGGEWSFGLGATQSTPVGNWQFSDSVVSTDTGFVTFTFNFQYDGTNKNFICRESNVSDDGGVYFDKFTCKVIPPILAKPYRIDSIDANGVCTLLNADFSSLAANIDDAGFATSATLTNYTEGDGWMPGVDVDPTPINSNSEFDDWDYSAELIVASDNRDFTTWGNVTWVVYNGATLADGSGKMQITLDANTSGASLTSGDITGSSCAGKCFEISMDVWQGTTTETDFRIQLGSLNNYKSITINDVADTTHTVTINSDLDNPPLQIRSVTGDSGTLFVNNVTIKEITPANFTVSGLSATNYLVYDTSGNTIRFVSDGGNLLLTTNDTIISNSPYFFEVGVAANSSNRVNLTQGGIPLQFMNDDETGHFQEFETTVTGTIGLKSGGVCNVTVNYFRLYKVEDTYAVCDGSQLSVANLLSNEFYILHNWTYKYLVVCDEISAGGVTPIAGITLGSQFTSTGTYSQSVKGRTAGERAGLQASTAGEGIKITELTLTLGSGPVGPAVVSSLISSIIRSIIRPIIG